MKTRITCLRVTSPHGAHTTFELTSARTTIGRSTPDGAPDLALEPDPRRLISRLHCVIEHADGTWTVSDNISGNGTFLSRAGERSRIFGKTRLQHADSVLILGDITEDSEPHYWKLKFDDPFRTETAPDLPVPVTTRHEAYVEYDWIQMRVYRIAGTRTEITGLTPQGHKLIRHMAELSRINNGSPVACTHDDLIQMLWGRKEEWPRDRIYDETNLRNVVNAVRKRIEEDPANPTILQTERNIGYRLMVESKK